MGKFRRPYLGQLRFRRKEWEKELKTNGSFATIAPKIIKILDDEIKAETLRLKGTQS